MNRALLVLLSLGSISTAQEWQDHGRPKPAVVWASQYAKTDYSIATIWHSWDHCDLEWDCIRDLAEMQEFRMDFRLYEDWASFDWLKHGPIYPPDETVKIFQRGGACLYYIHHNGLYYLCYPERPSYHLFDPIHFTLPPGSGNWIE
jgi:hypothetical protein